MTIINNYLLGLEAFSLYHVYNKENGRYTILLMAKLDGIETAEPWSPPFETECHLCKSEYLWEVFLKAFSSSCICGLTNFGQTFYWEIPVLNLIQFITLSFSLSLQYISNSSSQCIVVCNKCQRILYNLCYVHNFRTVCFWSPWKECIMGI